MIGATAHSFRPLPAELIALVSSSIDAAAQSHIEGRGHCYRPEEEAHHDLEETFAEALEAYLHNDPMRYADAHELWGFCGMVWNNSSDLPASILHALAAITPAPSRPPLTYASAARFLRRHMRTNKHRVRVKAVSRILP